MKLNEFINMSATARKKKINKIMESRFGLNIEFDKMSREKANKVLKMVNESIEKIRKSPKFHKSEKNPRYMELLMIKEGLSMLLNKASVSRGGSLITESEIGHAEVFLAAREVVDELQDMVEKVSRLQNERLPALKDTIRDRVGANEAETFVSSVGEILKQVVEQLAGARDSSDRAVLVLSGEETGQIDIEPNLDDDVDSKVDATADAGEEDFDDLGEPPADDIKSGMPAGGRERR